MKIFLKLILGFVLTFSVTTAAFSQLSKEVIQQIESLNREKEARTLVQKKVDSKLLYAAKQDRGEAITPLVRKLEVNVNKDAGGLVAVDIKVSSVTKTLLTAIRNAGGEITFQSALFKTINAKIPLQAIERIAASPEILFIYPADKASTNGPEKGSINKNFRIPFKNPALDRKLSKNFLSRADEIKDQLNDYFENKEEFDRDYFFIGSVTSEGDVTHRAAAARSTFGVNGTGVKIGVLSDGVTNLAASQASGDLGPVTVLPGQTGVNDEGTAMLEIIYDLAPGAQLYFATAFNSQASFAQNILDLRAAGCDIIVDDVSYFREAVFQDDDVARAVNSVTANGALYFGSAGNAGNKDDNTSGVWEGDFNDAGTGTVGTVTIAGGTVHNFGGGITNNQIVAIGGGSRPLGLFWSDPLGSSGNDYDLYVLNAGLTAIVGTSNNVQDGNDDPVELTGFTYSANNRVVIFKKTGAAVRALHLNSNRGRLANNTVGQTHGHASAINAYCVAATPAANAFGAAPNPTGPFPNPHNGTNQTELFSSDGPRRMFYNADGTPITPGNVLFATNGGNVRQKPDITAADGVSNTGPGDFSTRFYGTSAAAPHAAAIAGLLKSGTSSFTPAQIRNVLTSTAIDIETPGVDRNTGAGIVMAYESLQAVGAAPQPVLQAGAATLTTQSCTPGNGVIDPGETVTVSFCVQNMGAAATTNLVGTLQNTGGVTFAGGPQSYGAVSAGGTQVCRPFTFTASGACGSTITASINFQDGAKNLGTITYTFTLGVITQNPVVSNTNSASITIPALGAATPYPSNIAVAGAGSNISKVTVRLNGFNHTFPGDVDILLVSPTGQKVILMSNAGTASVTNANLIFDDAAASAVPGTIPSNATNTYQPSDYDRSTSLPAPAPARPYGSKLSTFNGFNPNGTWSLYVSDGDANDMGSITGGWTLNITTSTVNCCVTPPPVINAPTVTQPTCTTPTGTIVVNATGSGTLEYSIDNGVTYQPSNTFSGLAPGNYNIRVRQQTNPSNNSTYSGNPVVINAVPAAPAAPTVTVTQPNSNSATGTITVNTPTGTGFTYSINGSVYQASNIFNNLTPGSYSVRFKNSDGCISAPTAVTIDPQPAVLVAGATTITAQSCMPGNGVIDPGETVTVNFCIQNNGGTATTGNLTGTLQNTGGISGASAAQNYGVVPTGVSPVCRSFSFTANGTCGGTITASINLQDGATNLGTVTYTFTMGVITPNPAIATTNSASITIPDVAAATPYPSNITITGITNPVSKITVQLNNVNHTYPDDLDVLLVSPTGQKVMLMSDAGSGVVYDLTNANLIFDDAAASSIPDEGTIPSNATTTYKPTDYTGPDGTESLPAPAPARPYITTLSALNGLNPNGVWSLYVSDDQSGDVGDITGGWTLNITTSAAICCTAPPVVTAPTVTQPTCTTPTGMIVVNATGSGTLEYSVNNGTTYQLSNTFSGLAPGNYNIKVRQQANPANSTTYSGNPVVINAQPPTPATPTASVSQPICPATTGTITVNSPMGAGITYSINSTTYQASNVFNNVAPGSYNVTAKNSNGCVPAATPVSVNASPAAPAMPAVTVMQPSCTVATGTIVVNSPTGPTITYSINGTDYQAGTTFNNVAPGNYQVTAKNGSGCASAFTPVTINPQPATPATPTVMVTQPTCSAPTGSITVSSPGGAGITYSINGTTYQASNIFNNLTPGNYSVTAKNSSGCVSSPLTVTINPAPAAAPAAPTVTVMQPTCSSPSGSITITAPTGAGITYSINGTTYQAGTTFSNVSPGSYNVTAKNSSGCVSAVTPVTINATPSDNQPPVIPTNLTVFLNANSQASVTPASVAPLITDNCAVDPNSITVSANSFNCANITGSSTFQPFVATNATGNQNADEEQGMDFRVNAASGIVITQLGAFDHQANGLMGTQPDGNGGMGIRVAIFNKANQMIVPGLDVVITGNGDAFAGNYRYKNIPAVTLPPGDYLVLAKGYNANELMGNVYLGGGPYPQGDDAGGAISFLNTAFYDGSATPGFTYPAQSVNTGTSNIFKGGTFTYALSQSNTVTIKAADYAGNQSQVVANVMVVDTMYVLTTKNITVNLNSSGQATIQPRDVLQSYKNNCGIDVISSTLQVSPSSFSCADVGAATLSSPHQPFIAINSTGNQNADEEQGMDFRVNAASGIVITQLGAFDHQANGLMGTQPDGNGGLGIRVAIFNKANQMIVPGLDVVITGNGDAFAGNYRYKNIPAVTLPPGDYLVLAKGYNANELMGNVYLGGGPYPQGDNAGGAISFLNTAFYDGSATPGFTYPTSSVNTGTSNIFKGGTFTYKTKMAPGTLVTLTATDVYGNQKKATATVTVTDPSGACTAAPAMAYAAKSQKTDVPVIQDNVTMAVKVYPNPSSGQFTVQLYNLKVPKVMVQIMGANGQIIEQKAAMLTGKTSTLSIPIDISKQAPGIYIVKIISADGIQTTKVVVRP